MPARVTWRVGIDMTIVLRDLFQPLSRQILCTLHSEGNVHVPRIKETVQIRNTMYLVKNVTSVVRSDFTSEPQVVIDLKEM